MIGLDTNVILRWLLADDPAQKQAADELLGSLSDGVPGFVTEVTMAELEWALRKVYGLPKERVLDTLEELLASEFLEFDDGESVWQAVIQARDGADFADALIAETARLYGCDEVVTFDKGASRKLGMRLLS
ncbi:PIN domain-containing protein [Nocardioides speluncae]|uniref:PIN domain-containing protein n=1 Tax=Nocardioides speluncae TaxID=2670337 RepID=UPI000D6933D0|nr:type II toxin-antitoxin system VapC family toxin [Nocardioides speluncae]